MSADSRHFFQAKGLKRPVVAVPPGVEKSADDIAAETAAAE